MDINYTAASIVPLRPTRALVASIEGHGFWKIDLAVTRLVPVVSTHTLELRLEVFNLLNNFNWATRI